jgi:acylphosphatase
MIVAKRCLVGGRVQGVYFRASTQQQALKLGVVGYAKNLADGRVAVLAVGEAVQVEALVAWLWRGSPASQVTTVDTIDVALVELGVLPETFLTS